MKSQDVLKYLASVETPPSPPEDRAKWIEGVDAINLLQRSVNGDVPVYLSRRDFFIYAVLVPEELLSADVETDLMEWNFPQSSGWSYMPHEIDDDVQVVIHPPAQVIGSKVLEHSEPIVFERHFARRVPDEIYVEIDQKLAHLADVHWLDHRGAFCRLNEHGDIVDAITLYQQEPGKLCTIDAETLHRYLVITGQVMVQLFDIQHCLDWHQWSFFRGRDTDENERLQVGDLIVDKTVLHGPKGVDVTTLRGVQIVRGPSDLSQRKRLLFGRLGDHERKESFIINDWKNGQIREYPSKPNRGESQVPQPDLISPAFFRPQVLDRYKADPDKYSLEPSAIECRGVWYLRSYDINDAGQVYAYLKDLWALPHSEQQYWKLYNEPPKAEISERSIAQDMHAEARLGPDPLRDLRQVLRVFPRAMHDGMEVDVWSLPASEAERTLSQLHDVHTESKKEWQDQVLVLHKVVIEGLQTKPLRRVAKAAKCDNPEWRSIRLLRACLDAHNVPDSTVGRVCDPLHELNQLRSGGGVAHLGGSGESKDHRADFRRLLAAVAEAMVELAELIREGNLNLPVGSAAKSAE